MTGTLPIPLPTPARSAGSPSYTTGVLITAWLLMGILMLTGLSRVAVTRTQEARVLVTSSAMLHAPLRGWLIPTLNGNVRLQKPPLAYWTTAAALATLGVSDWAGRVPAALCGWLTIGLTMLWARRLFGGRAALISGAALCGSFAFFRYSRLAETDTVATLFVTAGVISLWRANLMTIEGDRRRPIVWFHLAAAAIALAALAKGPPALYPPLFFVTLCAIERQWRPLVGFIVSGAPVTAAVLAAPWFLYVSADPSAWQLVNDLQNSAAGGGHWDSFLGYIPDLFIASLPWTPFVLVALVVAIRQSRHDHSARAVLIWMAVILLPLCLWGNKQIHYLLPLLPPMMLLLGWLADDVLRGDSSSRLRALLTSLLCWTAAAGIAAAPGLIVVAFLVRGSVAWWDAALACGVAAASLIILILARRIDFEPAFLSLGATAAVAMFVIVGLWSPTLSAVTPRSIASFIVTSRCPEPYVFWGRESLPLCFYLHRVIPVARTEAEFVQLAGGHRVITVIETDTQDVPAPQLSLARSASFRDAKRSYRIGWLTDESAAELHP